MGIVLLILGILLTADAAAVTVMFDSFPGTAFTVGIFLILWGAGYKKLKNGSGFMKFINAVFKLFFAYILVMSCFLAIFGITADNADYTEDYIIVLGSAVRDSRPGPALTARLDTAAEYCAANPGAAVIVSGGRGPDENVSEAAVMYDYLTEHGVDPGRIIQEDNSGSTYENFRLSDEKTNGSLSGAGVVTITNDFHIFRAKLYAKLCGIGTHTLSAPTKYYLVPVSYVREALAMVKMAIYYIPIHFD